MLADSGLVSLDAPITAYRDSAPSEWTGITVRHLLNHTAGFAEQLIVACHDAPVLDVSARAQFDLIAEHPLMFPSGSRAAYSDPGYFLLGMIIEKASGLTYAEATRALIFDRCGMEKSLILDQ